MGSIKLDWTTEGNHPIEARETPTIQTRPFRDQQIGIASFTVAGSFLLLGVSEFLTGRVYTEALMHSPHLPIMITIAREFARGAILTTLAVNLMAVGAIWQLRPHIHYLTPNKPQA